MTKRIIGLFLALVLIFSNGIISYAGSENEAKITSPANNSWLDPYQTITVKWTAPAAGMTCKITILNERTGAYLTRNEKVSGTSYSIKSNTLDFEEKYKIWVGTFNGSEAIGGGSVIYIRMNDRLNSQKVYPEADFTSPKNNQEVSADSNLKITWNGNNDLAYQLSIKDLTTGMNIVNESSLTQTSYTISANQLEAGHSYKAWIGTYKKASYEKKLFSSGKNIEFKTAKATTTTGGSSTPPQRPTVTTPPTSDRPEVDLTGNPARINNPSNQAWVDPNQPIKVIWTVPATGLSCRLSIQNDVTGEYIVKNYEPSSNYYTISKNTLVEEQRYKITLTTYRDNTKIGESSEIYINTNNVDYPEATYSFPSAGAVINTTEKLTLRFSNMNSDLCYRISIVDTSDNSAILRNKLVSGSSYTLNANTLEPGKQYKLWIGTYLNANTEDALGSGEIIFINTANNQEEPQNATVQAYFTSPENNEVIDKDLGVTLKWSSSDKPTYYELTVKDETNGTYLVQNKLLTNTSYTIKSSELSKRHSYKAWVGTYNNKTSDKKLLGSGSELYFSTDGNLPALVTSLTADMKNDGLVFSYELTGDNLKYADILVKDSNEKIFYHEKVYQTTGQIVIPTADLKENTTYICEIQTYDTNDMKAAYKSQKYEVAKSGFSISNDAKKPSGDLPHKKGFTVKGTVTSAHPISEAKIVIFSRGNETDIHDIVHLTNYDKTADPNNKFNIYSYDSQVNFGSLQPGEYTYRVSVVDIMGNTYTAVETNFRIIREIGTYDDVSSDHPNYEAIKQLSIDGVLNGDGNGKFRPNASINRGEFVKMMCCAFNLSTSQSASSFRDVAQDYWATPYIMAAFQRKIVNGKGDGIFAPTASVTYEEAAKMLVCVKGWEESALQNGGWQNGGYTFVAEENDFFLKTTVASDQNYKKGATRADVAQMFYNALNQAENSITENTQSLATKFWKSNNANAVSLYATRSYKNWYNFMLDDIAKNSVTVLGKSFNFKTSRYNLVDFYSNSWSEWFKNEASGGQNRYTAVLTDALINTQSIESLNSQIQDNQKAAFIDILDVVLDVIDETDKSNQNKLTSEIKILRSNVNILRSKIHHNNNLNEFFQEGREYLEEMNRLKQRLNIENSAYNTALKRKLHSQNLSQYFNIAGDALDVISVATNKYTTVAALQSVKTDYQDGLLLIYNNTSNQHLKTAIKDVIDSMNASFIEVTNQALQASAESYILNSNASKEIAKELIKKGGTKLLVKLGFTAEKAVAKMNTLIGTSTAVFTVVEASFGLAELIAGTSTEAKAAIDLRILMDIEPEIKMVNGKYLSYVTNGENYIKEYVQTAEVLKPIMAYGCYLTNLIYTAKDKSAWNTFINYCQGKGTPYNDFDRIYNDEINSIRNIKFIY